MNLEDWMTVGTSIRSATAAWVVGLGPASQLVSPVRRLLGDEEDPLSGATLAVAVEDGRISQGWIAADATVSVRRRISRLRLVGPGVCVGEAKYADLKAKVTV